jgi:hypothetical protein
MDESDKMIEYWVTVNVAMIELDNKNVKPPLKLILTYLVQMIFFIYNRENKDLTSCQE